MNKLRFILLFAVVLLAQNRAAAYDFESGGIYYNIIDAETLPYPELWQRRLADAFLSKPEDLVPLVKNNHYAINRNDLSLRVPVEKALCIMADAAAKENISILVSSTFRSYDYQSKLYARNVKQLGQAAADRESARPGTSQHQLGTAIDFGSITDDFVETKQGKWLAKNAMKYGFSLSFPDGYEDVTGYRYECWHYRYIGVEACKMQQKWFGNIQQYMLEFLYAWDKASSAQ